MYVMFSGNANSGLTSYSLNNGTSTTNFQPVDQLKQCNQGRTLEYVELSFNQAFTNFSTY